MRSRLDRLANVNVVELLSMAEEMPIPSPTERGNPIGVKSAQFGHSLTKVGTMEVWNWLAGHASWSDHTNCTGYSPGGGEGMYSDWTVTELLVTL